MPRDFMECGGKRRATPLWLLFVSHASPNQLLRPKRRRASLAAALHMALTDTLNRTQGPQATMSILCRGLSRPDPDTVHNNVAVDCAAEKQKDHRLFRLGYKQDTPLGFRRKTLGRVNGRGHGRGQSIARVVAVLYLLYILPHPASQGT